MSETSKKTNEDNVKQEKHKVEAKSEPKVEPKVDDKDLTADDLEVYPERRGGKIKKNWIERKVDREDFNKIICEKKVFEVMKQSNILIQTQIIVQT